MATKGRASSRRDRPTVIDVARAAGVALGTVSRVLNNPESVGHELRGRVEQAIERLGYSPLRQRKGGRLAHSRPKRKGVIGFLVVGMAESLGKAPFLSDALRGVELEVAAGGEQLILGSVPGGDHAPDFLTGNLVDGVIARLPFIRDWREKTHRELLGAIERFPHVWLGGQPFGGSGDTVDCDFDAVGRVAAEYLFGRGHRHAVCLVPQKGWLSTATPQETFSIYAQRNGITVDWWELPERPKLTWPLTMVRPAGHFEAFARNWLGLRPAHRPTVMVTGTDHSAAPLYSVLRRHGIRVGVDLSIISLARDKRASLELDPELTSVDNYGETIGCRAVQQLRWRIAHADDQHCSRTRVQPKLIAGQSVARLRR